MYQCISDVTRILFLVVLQAMIKLHMCSNEDATGDTPLATFLSLGRLILFRETMQIIWYFTCISPTTHRFQPVALVIKTGTDYMQQNVYHQ